MDKLNRGAVFFNDKKRTDKDPDLRGNLVTDYAKYGIAGWKNHATRTIENTQEWQGYLFDNPSKSGDKHPDYTGILILPEGKLLLSGWHTQSKAGDNYISVSVKQWENNFTVIPEDHYAIRLRFWKD